MIKISSVILNYNGGKDTLECLSSLISQTGKNFNHELIVVDNASSDSSVELIEKKYPQIQVMIMFLYSITIRNPIQNVYNIYSIFR